MLAEAEAEVGQEGDERTREEEGLHHWCCCNGGHGNV